MSHIVLYDLDQNRRRLEYYINLKSTCHLNSSQPKTPKETVIDKWVEIYEERVQKLEKQVTKLGLRTELSSKGLAKSLNEPAQIA